VLPCPSIETCDGGPLKLSCFEDDYVSGGVVFKRQNPHPAALNTCFGDGMLGVHIAYALSLSCLETSNAFTTWH
jgi:hypothetical protein